MYISLIDHLKYLCSIRITSSKTMLALWKIASFTLLIHHQEYFTKAKQPIKFARICLFSKILHSFIGSETFRKWRHFLSRLHWTTIDFERNPNRHQCRQSRCELFVGVCWKFHSTPILPSLFGWSENVLCESQSQTVLRSIVEYNNHLASFENVNIVRIFTFLVHRQSI